MLLKMGTMMRPLHRSPHPRGCVVSVPFHPHNTHNSSVGVLQPRSSAVQRTASVASTSAPSTVLNSSYDAPQTNQATRQTAKPQLVSKRRVKRTRKGISFPLVSATKEQVTTSLAESQDPGACLSAMIRGAKTPGDITVILKAAPLKLQTHLHITSAYSCAAKLMEYAFHDYHVMPLTRDKLMKDVRTLAVLLQQRVSKWPVKQHMDIEACATVALALTKLQLSHKEVKHVLHSMIEISLPAVANSTLVDDSKLPTPVDSQPEEAIEESDLMSIDEDVTKTHITAEGTITIEATVYINADTPVPSIPPTDTKGQSQNSVPLETVSIHEQTESVTTPLEQYASGSVDDAIHVATSSGRLGKQPLSTEVAESSHVSMILRAVAFFSHSYFPVEWLLAATQHLDVFAEELSPSQVTSSLFALSHLQQNTHCTLDEAILKRLLDRAMAAAAEPRNNYLVPSHDYEPETSSDQKHLKPAEFAMLLHACVTFDQPKYEFVIEASQAHQDYISTMTVGELVPLLESYASMAIDLRKRGSQSKATVSSSENVLSGMQQLVRHKSLMPLATPQIVRVIVDTVGRHASELKGQEAAKAVAAVARLALPYESVRPILEIGLSKHRAIQSIARCSIGERARLLVGLARMGLKATRLRHIILPVLSHIIQSGRKSVSVRDISDIVWALGIMRADGRDYSKEVATLISWGHKTAQGSGPEKLLPKHCVQILVGLSDMQLSYQSNLRVKAAAQTTAAAVAILPDFSAPELAAATQAIGLLQLEMRHRGSYLIALEAGAGPEKLATLNPEQKTNMLVGVAMIASAPPCNAVTASLGNQELLETYLPACGAPLLLGARIFRFLDRKRLATYENSELGRILWSLAALETPPSISLPVLYSVCGVLEPKLPELTPSQMTDTVVGLSYFMEQIQLPDVFWAGLCMRLRQVLPVLKSSDLMNIAAAFPMIVSYVPNDAKGVCTLIEERTAALIRSLDVWDGMVLVGRAVSLQKVVKKKRASSELRKAVQEHVSSMWPDLTPKERRKASQMCQRVGAIAPRASEAQ